MSLFYPLDNSAIQTLENNTIKRNKIVLKSIGKEKIKSYLQLTYKNHLVNCFNNDTLLNFSEIKKQMSIQITSMKFLKFLTLNWYQDYNEVLIEVTYTVKPIVKKRGNFYKHKIKKTTTFTIDAEKVANFFNYKYLFDLYTKKYDIPT